MLLATVDIFVPYCNITYNSIDIVLSSSSSTTTPLKAFSPFNNSTIPLDLYPKPTNPQLVI